MTSSITLDRIVLGAKRVTHKTAYAFSFLTTILTSACDVPDQIFPEDGEEYSESEEGIEECIEGEGEGSGVITFQRTYGGFDNDEARSVIQTKDGGYALAGRTFSFGQGGDIYFVKTDAQGNLEWEKTFGGPEGDWANDIIQTNEGDYILVGGTRSFGAGSADMYLVKTDNNGNFEWQKTFGGSGIDLASSVEQTKEGGYILAGRNRSFGAGEGDMYIVKIDTFGNLEWHKTFGGSDDDWVSSVVQTTDGDYVLAGGTWSFGAGECDMYIVKIDTFGNLEWHKTFGGSDDDWASSVVQTTDGDYVLAGRTGSFGSGNWDMYLVKTDKYGNELWSKTFGGGYSDYARAVRQTSNEGYVLAGVTQSFGAGLDDMYLVKTDNNGNFEWQKTFGGRYYDQAESVQQAIDEGFILTGLTHSFELESDYMYLVKTDQNGNSPNPPE